MLILTTVELDGLGQVYEGDVVVDEEGVVALVFEDLGGGDLHPALLRVLPHVVRAQHQLHAARPVRAVARSHHPLIRDQGPAAEPLSQRKYFYIASKYFLT